jgi:hypothetical protein
MTLAVGVLILATGDYWYAYSFEHIEPGSTRATVVQQLGDPAFTSGDCYVAQRVDFENPGNWRHRPQVAYCAHWMGPGIDARFYAVGFDAEDRVLGVAYGSS